MRSNVRQSKTMKLAALSFVTLVATLCPAKSMGVIDYLVDYSINRHYSARYAPYAITRNLGVWPPWQPKIVVIHNSRFLWVRCIASRHAPAVNRSQAIFNKLSEKVLEPIAYYLFMPLVEIDCTLNGHPADPTYHWKFFGSNWE